MRRIKSVAKSCLSKWIKKMKQTRRLFVVLLIWIVQRCCIVEAQQDGETLAKYNECGGTLDQPRGIIMTPNYPEKEDQENNTYPNNAFCQWKNSVPDEHTLFIVRIWYMMLENAPASKTSNKTQCYDYLNITIASTGTTQLCRWRAPEGGKLIVKGVGPSLSITFVSDSSGSYGGVMLAYNSIPNHRPCAREPCKNGLCEVSADKLEYTCECDPGYTGRQCEIDINECESSPCFNGGTCKEEEGGGFSCDCGSGWQGELCEIELIENPCTSNPCREGATCEVDDSNGFYCICESGFTGDTCEQEKNECDSSPCQNGGQCVDYVNAYECACLAGWSGTTCEEEENVCASGPCNENQVCVVDDNDQGSYRCECLPGWKGDACNTEINRCYDDPCLNGGTCTPSKEGKLFQCECTNGYKGDHCELSPPQCRNPGIPYVKANASFSLGATLKFFCTDGFRLEGSSNLTCQSNNTWSNVMPICVDHLNNTVRFRPRKMTPQLLTFVTLSGLLSLILITFGAWLLIKGPWTARSKVKPVGKQPLLSRLKETKKTELVSKQPAAKDQDLPKIRVAWM